VIDRLLENLRQRPQTTRDLCDSLAGVANRLDLAREIDWLRRSGKLEEDDEGRYQVRR
jgi:hypothetical protein